MLFLTKTFICNNFLLWSTFDCLVLVIHYEYKHTKFLFYDNSLFSFFLGYPDWKCISDIPHDIDDDEFAEAEANEPWIQNVLINLHNLLNNFQPRLSAASFDQLISYLTNTVASTLERAVLKTKFTRLGQCYLF